VIEEFYGAGLRHGMLPYKSHSLYAGIVKYPRTEFVLYFHFNGNRNFESFASSS
jgi:hypothetical protein